MLFGEKLRTARMQKGLTQDDLAKLTGVSITTIGNYERGKGYPKQREVYTKLAEALDISVSALYNVHYAGAGEVRIYWPQAGGGACRGNGRPLCRR